MNMITDTTILNCGHTPSVHGPHDTGYGKDSNDRTFCYQCCADRDRAYMVDTGAITLYLTKDKVSNWPDSLAFKVTAQHVGKHNIAGKRYDVWFVGPDSHVWHGVQYGDMTQLCHCKRTKEIAKA